MSLKKICGNCLLRPLKTQDYKKFIKASGESFSVEEFVSFVNLKELDFFQGVQGVFFLFDSEKSFEMVGFSEINFIPSSNDVVIGYEIFPQFRRMGFGEKLLRLTVEMCEEVRATRILAKVSDSNFVSQKILTKCGFFESGNFSLKENEPHCLYYQLKLGGCDEPID